MKNFIIIISLFIGFVAMAQDITYLDEKNGFKIFRFGESYSKWERFLVRPDDVVINGYIHKPRTKVYKYVGNTPSDLFGLRWDDLYLIFKRNTLVKIEVKFYYDSSWQNQVLNSLKSVFGKPDDPYGSFYNRYVWRTEDTRMTFIAVTNKVIDTFTDDDKYHFYLEIESKKIKRELRNRKKQF